MGWYNNLSVLYKIMIIPVVGIIGFSLFLFTNYQGNQANVGRLEEIRDIYFPVLNLSSSNEVKLDGVVEQLNTAVTIGEADMLKGAESLRVEILESITKMKQIQPDREFQLKNIENQFNAFYQAAFSLSSSMIDGTADFSKIGEIAANKTALEDRVKKSFNEYHKESNEQFLSLIQQAEDANKQSLIVNFVIGTVTVGIILITSLAIALLMTRAIGSVVSSLKDIAKGDGDLTKRIAVPGNDEVGELVKWFNTFVEKLQGTIGDVIAIVSPLAEMAQDLKSVSANTNQVAIDQTRDAEYVCSSMNDMLASIAQVASHAKLAADAACDTDVQAKEGQVVVENTVQSIEQLASEVDKAANVILQLEKDSENVGGILDVIKGVAEQTNLLALNAAIEAARAGEQGRGFAVVADEVRTLASKTQESTLEIQTVIEQLQAAATQAVHVMQNGREQGKQSVEQVNRTGETLETITTKVGSITEMNNEIATATEKQQSASSSISGKVNEMQQAAESAHQATEKVADLSVSLEKYSYQLNCVAGQFKI